MWIGPGRDSAASQILAMMSTFLVWKGPTGEPNNPRPGKDRSVGFFMRVEVARGVYLLGNQVVCLFFPWFGPVVLWWGGGDRAAGSRCLIPGRSWFQGEMKRFNCGIGSRVDDRMPVRRGFSCGTRGYLSHGESRLTLFETES